MRTANSVNVTGGRKILRKHGRLRRFSLGHPGPIAPAAPAPGAERAAAKGLGGASNPGVNLGACIFGTPGRSSLSPQLIDRDGGDDYRTVDNVLPEGIHP